MPWTGKGHIRFEKRKCFEVRFPIIFVLKQGRLIITLFLSSSGSAGDVNATVYTQYYRSCDAQRGSFSQFQLIGNFLHHFEADSLAWASSPTAVPYRSNHWGHCPARRRGRTKEYCMGQAAQALEHLPPLTTGGPTAEANLG
jgi:hypothetical protein